MVTMLGMYRVDGLNCSPLTRHVIPRSADGGTSVFAEESGRQDT